MSIGLLVGNLYYEIGSSSFLKAFFSTIYSQLEKGEWGSRFPVMMNKFYQGHLSSSDAAVAIRELRTIDSELRRLNPGDIVWDFEDASSPPPWGSDTGDAKTAKDMFITSEGKDLLETLQRAMRVASELTKTVEIT